MRSIADRVRHALSFEIIGLTLFIPKFSSIIKQPAVDMGNIDVDSTTITTH